MLPTWVIATLLFTFVASTDAVEEVGKPVGDVDEVRRLLVRLLGVQKSQLFDVNVVPKSGENPDYFTICKRSGEKVVKVNGSSGVAVVWGVHHYLREYCRCHLSWQHTMVHLPSLLPDAQVTVTANDRLRYYQNVCTYGYSFVWWDWSARWEPHLDWMALTGINLALAPVGQELVWRNVFLSLGLNNDEVNQHFSGPAFLPWNRMGNMRGWGGPLTDSWHTNQYRLQKRILQRMAALGITPVFPAFSGTLPRAMKRIFPNANLTKLTKWNDFEDTYCCPYFLSPTDPLFGRIGNMFLKEYASIYGGGDNRMYSCDPFNEMTPPEGTDLKAVGESIFSAMTSVDRGAVWVLQGWMFANEMIYWTKDRARQFLTSVPQGRLLVIDLQSDKTPQYTRLDHYFGQPYVWSMLHNFGGVLGLHGSASVINTAVHSARKEANSTLVGIGLTPEGINQNYVVYELMLDNAWRDRPADLDQWFDDYSRRRYGAYNGHTRNAWKLLKDSVYNYRGNVAQHGMYTLVRRPSLNIIPDTWYDPDYVYQAWEELLAASSSGLNSSSTYLYDLVDVTRQAGQLILDDAYARMVAAFRFKRIDDLERWSSNFLTLIADMDKLLATNRWFLLGDWIRNAKMLATSPLESKLYEKNARNQITLWGPNGQIVDYANRQWSGLLSDYYLKRWDVFVEELRGSLISGRPFRKAEVTRRIFLHVEQPFTYSTKRYPHLPVGDTIEISKMIYKRWRPEKYLSDS